MNTENIISNVRQQSAAGWFVGSLSFCVDNAECWDKDTPYYPSESFLTKLYPHSISLEEAFEKAKMRGWTNMVWKR